MTASEEIKKKKMLYALFHLSFIFPFTAFMELLKGCIG